MERHPVSLTEQDLNQICLQVSSRIQQRIKHQNNGSNCTSARRATLVRKSTNELVIMITQRQDDDSDESRPALQNPLMQSLGSDSHQRQQGSSERRECDVYLAVVSLDELDSDQAQSIPKLVRVHKLCYEKFVGDGGKYGFERSENLPFEPTDIVTNTAETAFVLYSSHGVFVGNFPSNLENMRQTRECSQNLQQPVQNVPIELELVYPESFQLEQRDDEQLTIIQAEFNHLNTNYLNVLTRTRSGRSEVKHSLMVFNLASSGLACEFAFDLDLLVKESHLYGLYNKDLQFVGFTQCCPNAAHFFGLDMFQVHLLTSNGHVYSLCPVLLQEMVFREDHFSQILVLLNDQIQANQEEQLAHQSLSRLRMALAQGKTKENCRPGMCQVRLPEAKQKELIASMEGPLKVVNAAASDIGESVYSQILSASSYPFSLIAVSDKNIELLLTFEQPHFMFQRDKAIQNDIDELALVKVSQHPLPKACQGSDKISFITRDVLDELIFFFHSTSPAGSNLIKLDLSALSKLREDFEDDKPLDMQSFSGIKATRPKMGYGKSSQYLVAFNHYSAQWDTKSCSLALQSSKIIHADRYAAFQSMMREAEKNSETQLSKLIKDQVQQAKKVDWMPSKDWVSSCQIKIPGDGQQSDISSSQLQKFSEQFIQQYCGHFDKVEGIFDSRFKMLIDLKAQLDEQARTVNKAIIENEKLKSQLDAKLHETKAKNDLINKKISSIQTKIQTLTNPFPDDFVLQLFIEELSEKVRQRQSTIQVCIERTKDSLAYQRLQYQNIRKVGARVDQACASANNMKQNMDPRCLSNLKSFVVETMPQMKQLEQEVSALKSYSNMNTSN